MHGEGGVQEAQGRADAGGEKHAAPEGAAEENPGPAGHAACGHDAFDAQIQDSGPFADQFAHGAEYERGGHAYGGQPESGFEKKGEDIHFTSSGCGSGSGTWPGAP
jgi:hypothetical protein